MDPKFSILVPTRQRPDTLLATLATLIWQPGEDYEIVVADNFGDEDVAAVIAALPARQCVSWLAWNPNPTRSHQLGIGHFGSDFDRLQSGLFLRLREERVDDGVFARRAHPAALSAVATAAEI